MLFLRTDHLWHLIWILPLFFILWTYGAKHRNKMLLKVFNTKERFFQFTNYSPKKRALRYLLLTGAIVMTAITIARPSWGNTILPETSNGRDLLVVFDVSRSMLADDIKPDRFSHAKWLVRELSRRNAGDRFGLIAFAGTSFLVCPLTMDQTSFVQMVDELDTDTIPIGGTNIQHALETATEAFKAAEGNHKAVILVTDGDELTGNSAEVIEQLNTQHIPLLIAGIGDPSVPAVIRIKDNEGKSHILTDNDGNTVKSPLNEAQLGELARKTGGIYVRSTATADGLSFLQDRIRALEQKHSDEKYDTFRPIEHPGYSIAAALIFLLLFFLIPETRATMLMLCLLGLNFYSFAQNTPATAQSSSDQSGAGSNINASAPATNAPNTNLKSENKPEKKLKDFKTATEYFNEGYKAQTIEKNNELAVQYYGKAIALSESQPEIRTAAYQNIGVIEHQQAKESISECEQAIQGEKLDEAEKLADTALAVLDKTESLYHEGMRYNGMAKEELFSVRNQQILLNEREKIETLKKLIEELKQLQQQAQQQTKDALNQQQQQNQQDNQEQDKQQQQNKNQEQDNQQQQNKDQGQDKQQDNQDNQQQNQDDPQQQSQNSPEDKTKEAENTVSEMKEKAEQLKQEKMKENAEKVQKELQEAMKAQQNNQGKEAEEHLEKAYEMLKQQPKQENQTEEGDNDQQHQDLQNQDQNQQKDKQPDQKQREQGTQEPKEQENQELDQDQAEALLRAMEQNEKQARQNQKEKIMEQSTRVEKDW